jgi:ABC-type lipoprotein export system ATPase subunit
MTSSMPAVLCDNLVHIYRLEDTEVVALRGVDLQIEYGETLALLGPSGSGKSTLLSLLGGLLRPSAGRLYVAGHDIGKLTSRQMLSLRLRDVGVVFQNPGRNLLPYATAGENLAFAQQGSRRSRASKRRRAQGLLDAVGLSESGRKPVRALSGGEQQRLSVAVGLANGPTVLLADEPTSQLDRANSEAVIELLKSANADLGTTVILVTHDPEVGAAMGRTVTIRDGRVGAEGRRGEEYAVVGRDGSVHLPQEVLDLLPPGSLARVLRRDTGVELQRVETVDEEPA